MTTLTIPTLETERLRLRTPLPSDVKAYVAYRTGPRTAYVGGPRTEAQAFHDLSAVVGQWQLRGYGRWIVADKNTDAPMGLVGIFHPLDWPEAEIGWTVFDHAEGRGIATEAALAARSYAYDVLGWQRIVSMITPDNDRSIALAKRLAAHRKAISNTPISARSALGATNPRELGGGGMEAYA